MGARGEPKSRMRAVTWTAGALGELSGGWAVAAECALSAGRGERVDGDFFVAPASKREIGPCPLKGSAGRSSRGKSTSVGDSATRDPD